MTKKPIKEPEQKKEDEDKDMIVKELESKIGMLEKEIEVLNKQLQEERDKSDKYLAGWKRAEADFNNYKKRSEQEKSEIGHSTTCNVLCNILPVLDDFERALAVLPPDSSETNWAEGVKLIYKKLRSILESMGVEEVCAMGQPFDPSLHEAVAHMDGEEGAVINEVQKGYKIKDRLLRPAKVVVGRGTESENNESIN